MVFSNIGLILFIPVALLWFYLLKSNDLQNLVIILVSSSLFIASGPVNFIVFCCSVLIALCYFWLPPRFRLGPTAAVAAIVAVISNLVVFKYSASLFPHDFVVNTALRGAGIVIPLGISFYTFHIVGAIVDLREPGAEEVFSTRRFVLFCLFFPQLVAGPIVRYRWLSYQFDTRKRATLHNLAVGTHFFALGLFKKVFIADQVARIVDPVFAHPGDYGTLSIMAASLGFYTQVYADFSGYTDMARGIARLFGFRLPLNFRAPYLTASPVEFWSRWHISLSTWVRDYLYIPMAAKAARSIRDRNRRALAIFCIIMFVMVVLGVWHGAAWRFVAFGAFHGLLIVVWRSATGGRQPRTTAALVASIVIMQLSLVLSFVVFRAADFWSAAELYRGLFVWRGGVEGMSQALLVAAATLLIFVMQAIDWNIGARGVRRVFYWLHSAAAGRLVLTALLLMVITGKVIYASDAVAIAGVSLHAPRVQFIYFDF
jgi:alginate O-acetyltransferase complex protein AlgI